MKEDLKNFIVQNTNYTNPSRYLSGRICEYDIKSANITMLYNANIINYDYYLYLSKLPKINREKEIGLMIRDDVDENGNSVKNLCNIIQQGIIQAKLMFIDSNNIELENIARIANDAIYINKPYDLENLVFGNVEFRKKLQANSMVQLRGKLIIFSWYINDNINIEVKGINEYVQSLHQEYMLTIIANVIYLMERVSVEDAIEFLSNFYEEYVNLKLPIQYYRELNSESLYRIKGSRYCVSNINDITMIDINYNLLVLRDLYSILIDMYNQCKKY